MNTKQSLALASTSAMAAGIAHGSVVYSGPLNLEQIYSDASYRQGVDMTGDGVNDFAFGFEANAQKPYVDARTYVGTDVPGQSGIVSLLSYANTGFPVTPSGTMIDGTYATTYPAMLAGRGYMYEDGNGDVAGDWSNTATTDAYVGIELSLTSGTSYGWLHFNDNPTAQSLTLVDWAYESSPGVGIETGAVPEPSSLALGGIGIAALLKLRRRK